MGDVHESLLVEVRRKTSHKGFRETKCPLPTFRPDYFGRKQKSKKATVEMIVEAETESSLFYEHTTEQLILMQEYMQHQKQKRIGVRGRLVVPKTKKAVMKAVLLLESLFDARDILVWPIAIRG